MNEKILEENFRVSLNQNPSIKIYDYNLDLLQKDETLNKIITTYDDKMQRLSKELENNEKKILAMNEKNKKMQKEVDEIKLNYENEKKLHEHNLREIIQQYTDIVIQLKNTLEVDLSDETLKEDVYNKLKEGIQNIEKTEENWKWLGELRLSIAKAMMIFHDITFKQINLEENYSQQKTKWQYTLDQVLLSNEEEINRSNSILKFRDENN